MHPSARAVAVKELEIEDLPQDMQDSLLVSIGENIMRGVAIAALERLSPEDQEMFGTIAEEGDERKTLEFLSSKIPDFNTFVADKTKKVIAEVKAMAE